MIGISRTGSPFPVPRGCRLRRRGKWPLSTTERIAPRAGRRKAGRQRGAPDRQEEGHPGPKGGAPKRVLGRFPRPTTPAPSKGNPVPGRPETTRIRLPPQRSRQAPRALHRAGTHQLPVPTSSAQRTEHWVEKMAKIKLSPPTRKTNHTPCIPQPSSPWPAPAVLLPGPRGAPVRAARAWQGHGSEWE